MLQNMQTEGDLLDAVKLQNCWMGNHPGLFGWAECSPQDLQTAQRGRRKKIRKGRCEDRGI